MSKRVVYHISGFDCPNCAANAERHLSKDANVLEVTLDFNNERLYINYADNPYTIDQLKNKIAEVEEDPIRIQLINKNSREKVKIFTFDFIFDLSRIILSAVLLLIGFILEKTGVLEEFSTSLIVLYSLSLVIVIYDIIIHVFKNIIKLRNPLDIELLMTISSLGIFTLAFLTHYGIVPSGNFEIDLHDGVLVIILYQIGELIEGYASSKSKIAISDAIDLRADSANLVLDNKIVQVKPETLNIGDKIIVRVGEIVPVDGEIIEGQGTLDMSSLTGEPMPVDALVGENVLSGSILKSGSLTIVVNKVFADSSISKILELVKSSGERKAKYEKFIDKFARIYTPSVFGIAIIFAVVFGLVNKNWTDALFTAFAILVVSCPCAIVISVPLAFFAGIGLASKRGVIIKGGSYIDSLAKIGVLFFDKTGTLTYGNFQMRKVVTNNVSEQEFNEALLSAESRSNHPIAKAITLHKNISELALKQEEYEELPGLGTKTKFKGSTIIAGNYALLQKYAVSAGEIEEPGTVIYVAKEGKFIGYVVLEDIVRDKAKELIKRMDALGIKTVLLSGDKELTVQTVANKVGIKEYHAGLLPQDKTKYLEEEMANNSSKRLIAFAGDGINDTPSIIRADVGFAMGGIGSDVAVENADVVIMQDHPLKIYDAIKISKLARFTALFNIIFSLTVKATVIILLLAGVLGDYSLLVAALSDTGLSVIMILHSLSLFYRKLK